MNNISKIALLKLIRQYQPISLNEIAHLIESDEKLRKSQVYRELLNNIKHYPHHPVEDLLALNLIETEGNTEYTSYAKLVPSSSLARLQSLFGFSLSKQIEATENTIQVSPIFKTPKLNKQIADIFVAMPFREELKPIYTDHILKVTKELGISCNRGDDFFTANHIMDDVWSAIYHSKLCIVDCTGRNANVFYELGIAHTLGHKAILISRTMDDIPFDVQHLRTIIYVYTPRGMQEFEQKLRRTIEQELDLEGM